MANTLAWNGNIPFGNKEDRLELELTLNGEVLHRQVILPVIGQALVKRSVFLDFDVRGVPCPDRLHFVQFLVRRFALLDLLRLLLLWLLFLILYFLDLWLLFFCVFLLFLLFLLVFVLNFL